MKMTIALAIAVLAGGFVADIFWGWLRHSYAAGRIDLEGSAAIHHGSVGKIDSLRDADSPLGGIS